MMIFNHLIALLFACTVYSNPFEPIRKFSTTLSFVSTVGANVTTNIFQDSRLLEDQKNNNGNYQYKFLKKYSIKFRKCVSLPMFSDGENRDQRRNLEDKDQQKNDYTKKIYSQHLVHFRLCEYDSCSDSHKDGCRDGYGDYIVDMQTFLEGYVAVMVSDRENLCENIADRCNCVNNDDDNENKNNQNYYRCKLECFTQYNLNDCIEYLNAKNYEEKYGRDEYDVSLDDFDGSCKEFGGNDNEEENDKQEENDANRKLKNNMNDGLFIGPYCSDDGDQILMGVFYDDVSVFQLIIFLHLTYSFCRITSSNFLYICKKMKKFSELL